MLAQFKAQIYAFFLLFDLKHVFILYKFFLSIGHLLTAKILIVANCFDGKSSKSNTFLFNRSFLNQIMLFSDKRSIIN
jgi:hypothetical protein